MAMITGCGGAEAPRGWRLGAIRARLAGWAAARRSRAALAEIPPGLRKDVGLDGGLPLSQFENGGRTFIANGRPDVTLSGWRW